MSWQKGVALAHVISRPRASLIAIFGGLLLVTAAPTGAPVAQATSGAASSVVSQARRHIGARYQSGSTGPSSFDCSGLVYRVFSDARLASKIGGNRSSAGLYAWFRSRGLAGRSSPQVGDLVVYGYSGRVSHVGIYIGGGNVISALTSGVRVHRTTAVNKPFIAYLHTRLSGSAPRPQPAPARRPTVHRPVAKPQPKPTARVVAAPRPAPKPKPARIVAPPADHLIEWRLR